MWGAVFEVPAPDLEALHAREAEEGRVPRETQAMDREGRRHRVLVHVCESPNGEMTPARTYLELMVSGGRHWRLPAGWVASLEEHLEDI